jgi:arylsulfatase A-like enzyme
MLAALRGGTAPRHEFMYSEFHERGFQQALRMGRWKAVRIKKDAPLELYDLDIDPGEKTNVAAAHAGIVERIETYLRTARTESTQWPVK